MACWEKQGDPAGRKRSWKPGRYGRMVPAGDPQSTPAQIEAALQRALEAEHCRRSSSG